MSEITSRLGLPLLASGQAQKELTHNEALALIDFGLAAAAENAGLNAPPAAPMSGQCWIVGAAPTGAWSGQAEALACWTEGGWRFLPAIEGSRVWLKDDLIWAVREADGWALGDVRGERVVIGGQQVVGARQAGVPAPAGGPVVDTEARAAIAEVLDRLVAHGLIAG